MSQQRGSPQLTVPKLCLTQSNSPQLAPILSNSKFNKINTLQLFYLVTIVHFLNEAPRSKLRGITELKQAERSEIFAGLPLPLHIPFYGLPVCPLPRCRHIVPVGPKLPAPQHPFDGRLSPKDRSRCDALENLHIRPGATFGCALQSRWR